MSPTVLMIAGEASGDKHGARLARELKRLCPGMRVTGIGGEAMRRERVETFVDSRKLAVIGLWEVLDRLGEVRRALKTLARCFRTDPPDGVVLIDFPDFNMLVGRMAHAHGIPVVYYISPQIWAWRRWRARKIGRWARKILVIFPFEVDFYRRYGVNAEFVGHPLLDHSFPRLARERALGELGLDPAKRYVGLLPGSRRSEVRHLFPGMLSAAEMIRQRLNDVEFLLPLAPGLSPSDIPWGTRRSRLPVHVTRHRFGMTAQGMDAALVASGSATLEIALWGVPQCIVYRLSPITYAVGRLVVRVPFIGIVNLIAGRRVAAELIQHQATPGRMAREITALLLDPTRRERMLRDYMEIRKRLGSPGASRRAAQRVLEVLQGRTDS